MVLNASSNVQLLSPMMCKDTHHHRNRLVNQGATPSPQQHSQQDVYQLKSSWERSCGAAY